MSLARNKAHRIDKLPTYVIKDSAPVITPSTTSIIIASLTTSTSPRDWKIAEVSPILKEGDFEDAGNNRPISLWPILRARKISEFHLARWATNSQVLLVPGKFPSCPSFELINNS